MPRLIFQSVLNLYQSSCDRGFELKGGFSHFRRIIPNGWPRTIHYELLDEGTHIGCELHLESDEATKVLAPKLIKLADKIKSMFPNQRVQWDPSWLKNRGRLRILFSENDPAESIVEAMKKLIQISYFELDVLAKNIAVRRENNFADSRYLVNPSTSNKTS